MSRLATAIILVLILGAPARAEFYYTIRPDDPQAVYLTQDKFAVRGDGVADDTDAIRKAIAGHRTIYLPSGKYVVSDMITLKHDTVLVGLHHGR
jgi:hypothetical protein